MSMIDETQRRLIEKLQREFGTDIMAVINDPDVVEIMLNPDGTLWIEKMGEAMQCMGKSVINPMSPIGTVASFLGTSVTTDNPILECELPLDGSRFEALIPPVVSRAMFTIRKKASRIFTLEDYLVKS